MPVCCAIKSCQQKHKKGSVVSFYRFPMCPKNEYNEDTIYSYLLQRIAWINATKRNDIDATNIHNYRICSKHFVSGKKCDDVSQRSHPDWAPTVNLDIAGEIIPSSNIVSVKASIDKDIQPEEIHKSDNIEIDETDPAVINDIEMDETDNPAVINAINDTEMDQTDDLNATLQSSLSIETVSVYQPTKTSAMIIDTECFKYNDHTYANKLNNDFGHNSMCNEVDDSEAENAGDKNLQDQENQNKYIDKSTETNDMWHCMESVLNENTIIIADLREKLKKQVFDISNMDDAECRYYTGLPTRTHFNILLKSVEMFLSSNSSSIMAPSKSLLLTLVKLRLGLDFCDLGYRFKISANTASRTFYKCITILYNRLKPLVRFPNQSELINTMPRSFKKYFGNKVSVIIDCTEIFIETPKNPKAAAEVFSSYKNHSTQKYLIGITPQGTVSFISDAYGGRASDGFITLTSGLLDEIRPGTIVLADKGFTLNDSFSIRGAELKQPAFVYKKQQLHPIQLEETRHLANVRIHVEREIGFLKRKFTILHNTFPCSMLFKETNEPASTMDQIMVLCCGLINLCPSVVPY